MSSIDGIHDPYRNGSQKKENSLKKWNFTPFPNINEKFL